MPAGLVLIAITRTLPRGAWRWKPAVLGVLNIGGFFALLFVSAYRLPGGVAATLSAIHPIIVAMLVLAPGAALGGIEIAAGLLAGLSSALGVILLGFAWLVGASAILAYLLWFRGVLAFLASLMATALGCAVLGQSLTWIQALGAVVIVASVMQGQSGGPVNDQMRHRAGSPGACG